MGKILHRTKKVLDAASQHDNIAVQDVIRRLLRGSSPETGTESPRAMYKMPFADFDPARFMADFKVPAFDAEGAMALHRKNVEAMTAAGQTAFEGAGAFFRRQNELAREAAEAAAANVNMFFGEASFEDKAERGATLAKGAWDSTVAGAGELADMSTKTGREVLGLIDKRVREAMDETAAMIAPAAKPAEKAAPKTS